MLNYKLVAAPTLFGISRHRNALEHSQTCDLVYIVRCVRVD